MFKNQKTNLEELLALLRTTRQVRGWNYDLQKSGLVDNLNRVRSDSGLDRGGRAPIGKHQMTYCTLLYFICRADKPATVVETGVGAGTSSSFILQAMNDNGQGNLYSIERIKDQFTDIFVDKELCRRWHLIRGRSVDRVPELVEKIDIDIFLHDSEHSYRNMTFEYKTAWPKIKDSGYLLSDDIIDNFGFYKFAGRVSASMIAVIEGFGIIRKSDRNFRT